MRVIFKRKTKITVGQEDAETLRTQKYFGFVDIFPFTLNKKKNKAEEEMSQIG